MPVQSFRKLHWGEAYSAEEALKDNIVNEIYESQADAEKLIADFAKKYAPLGKHRGAVKNNKENMFKQCLDVTKNLSFAPGPMDMIIHKLSNLPKAKL
jgi:enoyl-CoA hydratase/carnithine racemase